MQPEKRMQALKINRDIFLHGIISIIVMESLCSFLTCFRLPSPILLALSDTARCSHLSLSQS